MTKQRWIQAPWKSIISSAVLGGLLAAAALSSVANDNSQGNQNGKGQGNHHSRTNVLWLNHFDLLPGDSTVLTTFNAVNSGVGAGLTALVVQSTTLGDTAPGGGVKVVQMAVEVPPGFRVVGVRVCYELTSTNSFINEIRLAQVQNPPSFGVLLLDDPTSLTNVGPVCLNSQPPPGGPIDPEPGALLLAFRVNFGNLADKIAIRAVALLVVSNNQGQSDD